MQNIANTQKRAKPKLATLASLQRKATLIVVLAITASMGTAAMFFAQKIIVKNRLDQLTSVASIQKNRVLTALDRRRERVRLVASRTQLRVSLKNHIDGKAGEHDTKMRRILNDAKRSIPDFLAIHIVDSQTSTVLVSTVPAIEGTIFQQHIKRENWHGKESVDEFMRGGDGKIQGLMFATLSLDGANLADLAIQTTITDLESITQDYTGLGETGETVLARLDIDGGATFLVPLRFDPDSQLTRRVNESQTDVPVLQALQQFEGVLSNANSYRGHPALAATKYIDGVKWGIAVIQDRQEAFSDLNQMRISMVAIATVAMLLGIAIAIRTANLLSASIGRLVKKSQSLASGQRGSDSMPVAAASFRITEIEQLDHAYDVMTQELVEQAELLAKEVDLKTDALKQLQSTQAELVRNEKLAYLGQTASALGHEVSTPLGITKLAISHVQPGINSLRSALDDESLSQEDLVKFLDETDEAISLVSRNSSRVVEIINSFKSVAVDQASNRYRWIKLDEYIHEIIHTIRLTPEARRADISIEIPGDIGLHSTPGALSQVVINLVLNSAIHGIADDLSNGRIEIHASQLDEQIELIIADNGKGMTEQVRAQAFDEFFTTRGDSGGSGVGLHVVRNLIEEQLHGALTLETSPGNGTKFTITLPLELPAEFAKGKRCSQ